MRRLSRSILVLSIVVALNVPTTYGRPLRDDDGPRPIRSRIVKVIKQIMHLIGVPDDDGNQLIVPKP